MLRPERMSRVSVTGSKRYMDDVVETVHDLRLMDVTDYDGAWEGFAPGDPVEGADAASEKLVTVRSLESILGVTEEDAGPTRIVTEEAIEEELPEVRERVNDLDDERDEVEDDLRAVEEQLDTLEPFAKLGIEMDLLGGYDHLTVAVGEGDRERVRRALVDADDVERFQLFDEDGALAVFASPADAALEDALVGTEFTRVEVPDAEGDPEEYAEELRHRKQTLESRLSTLEDELENLRLEVGGFLLAAEEKLAIEAQKREAPLSFATTENAFVAEGWLPTERFVDLAEALSDEVGDHVDIEELERADYDEHGFAGAHADKAPAAGGGAAAADGGEAGSAEQRQASPDGGELGEITEADDGEVATDGGHAAHDQPMSGGEPPVVQDNHGSVKPFEALTQVINKPKYWELDPTVVLFLTFPAMFGFMIGDLGYGLGYLALGYALYSRFDSEIIQSLGGVMLWAGGFTALFGILYGEFFGLHELGAILWGGHPPIEKGLSPDTAEYARLWLVVSVLVGLLHVTVGHVFGFFNDLSHGIKDAVTENASWILLMGGIWTWVFTPYADDLANSPKPAFLFHVFDGEPFPLGFAGFPELVGWAGLGVAALGFVLLIVGEGGIGVLESLNVLVNVLSYTRIAAVLLAKAGMAFVVNLLFFGVYVTREVEGGEPVGPEIWHFGLSHSPAYYVQQGTYHGEAVVGVMFPGLVHGGAAAFLLGVVVLLVGHLLVLALGITSAGLQAVRLEYVEFFQKFYEGGGRDYSPFGYERRFTTED